MGKLEEVCADASFRKYYRLESSLYSGIVMDASLQKESLLPFIDISNRLHDAGVKIPKIFKDNIDDGFLLMEDLGNTHLFNKLDEDFEPFYSKAIDGIVKMQNTNIEHLPNYDEKFIKSEMDLMEEWYFKAYLEVTLNQTDQYMLFRVLNVISQEVLSQPQGVFVHRDYHSKNIMITPNSKEVAIIDYQDAKVGPVTYDLVSLLRDVYVELEPKYVQNMALEFRDKKELSIDDETFIRWFDFMGLQRHIKILGIFARLSIRDGKNGYLNNIPLTLKYIKDIASKSNETEDLFKLLKKLIND
jgi:aminoglycoside/choline kinase family phosphotransferase